MGTLTFNGICSSVFGIRIATAPNYDIPEKDYQIVHVPGKSGDIYLDTNSYKNVNRTYSISFPSNNLVADSSEVAAWLFSSSGYARLEDTYEPSYFRMAAYKGPNTIAHILNQAGAAKIIFNCKPQRFLKSGEQKTNYLGADVIVNPTKFESQPTIIVDGMGEGNVYVGNQTIHISSINRAVTIDSEAQDIYSRDGAENRNSTVTFSNNAFPKFVPGDNEISFDGGVIGVEVIPKWWTI